MRAILARFLAARAERRTKRGCDLQVGAGTKVNYRSLGQRLPQKLNIGAGSIIQANIIADRKEAVVSIGDNTFIGNSRLVCAREISIGNNVLISWGCTIVDHNSHSTSWAERSMDVKDWHVERKDWTNVKVGKVTICDKVWIGFNSIVLKGVTIGEGAVVGAGSVVTRDVEPYTIVAGNPASVVRPVR